MNKILNNLKCISDEVFTTNGEITYSWRDVENAVSALTQHFRFIGIGPSDTVAINANKDFYTYASILACYVNGIAFSPILFDENPRLGNIFSILSPTCFLSSTKLNNSKDPTNELVQNIIKKYKTNQSLDFLYRPEGDRIAYIMFSSGSTGAPKAIPITYQNLHAYLDGIDSIASFEMGSVFSQAATLTFDLAIHDIFTCFRYKGFLLPLSSSIAKLAPRFVNEHKVNHIMAVPSFYQLLGDSGLIMPSVKNIFFCGEALRSDILKQVIACFPNANYFNLYGPTEATVAISYYKIDPSHFDFPTIIPIGIAIPGSELALTLDRELLLGGPQVFKGYLNQSEANSFIDVGGEKYYRSGDICKYDGDNYHFLGRLDFQIKYRGYRLELEGLEAMLGNRFGINFGVIGYNQSSENNYSNLAIFYNQEDLIGAEILKALPANLAGATIFYIKEFPRNLNGKIDRKALINFLK